MRGEREMDEKSGYIYGVEITTTTTTRLPRISCIKIWKSSAPLSNLCFTFRLTANKLIAATWFSIFSVIRPLCGVLEQVGEYWGRSRHDGGASKESAWHYRLLLRLCCFALIGQRNYETDLLRVLAVQCIAGLFRFLLSFAPVLSLTLHGHPVQSWMSGHGGLACHVYWDLGSQRALLWCLDLCSSFVVCHFA